MTGEAAVLLISHGSRQPHAAALVDALAARVRADDPARVVATGFLELNRPTPVEALRKLAVGGAVAGVTVVPLLFSAGQHYRIDVPAAVEAVRESHPGLTVQITAPLMTGADAELSAALDARLNEATSEMSCAATTPVLAPDGLVLLAAGSADPDARAAVTSLARTWGRGHGVLAEAAFCDLSGDDVRARIAQLHTRGARHVACGSLFLAAGRLLDAGRRAALEAGADAVAGPIGMTPALVDLVRRRSNECSPAG